MGVLELALICFLASVIAAAAAAEDVTVYVDPFIGTEGPTGNGANSGDTFPGVSVPFGMVKIGPDTNEADQASNPFAGYTPDGNGMLCLELCYRISLID
jgi:putative alpha-1,2-mannosidase